MYISPTGSGLKDGSSWANAAIITNLDAMVAKAGPGGSVLLRADAGTYNMGSKSVYLSHGGAEGAPVTIKGVDVNGYDMAAQFVGNRATDETAASKTGAQLFVLRGDANDVTFSNIDVKNVSTAFRVESDLSNIEIGNVNASNVKMFFEDRTPGTVPSATATIDGLYIHDVNVIGYSRSVIYLKYDSHNIRIEDVVGDSAGKTFDNFAMGAHLDDTVHNVVFERVSMLNNQNFLGTYWNGDGFSTEGGTHHITFIDTLAAGSTDGGYDLKSDYTTLIRTVASDNSRNYRIWGNNNVMIDSVGTDPHSRMGGMGSQIWMAGGADISISGSEFKDSGLQTKIFNFDGAAKIYLNDMRVSYAEGAVLNSGGGNVIGLDPKLLTIVQPTGHYSSNSTPTYVNHPLIGDVTITGDTHEGGTLSAGHTLSDLNGIASISYHWLRNGVEIPSATSATYTLTQADVGASIRVAISTIDGRGNLAVKSSATDLQIINVNDAPKGTVEVQGAAIEGARLNAISSLDDEDGMGAISYQWLRDGQEIEGGSGATWTLSQSDVGHAISVRATYTDGFGHQESVASGATGSVLNVNNVATGTVTINGNAAVGQLLTATYAISDLDGLGEIHYQWMRGDSAIAGALGATYAVANADAGQALGVKISFTDGHGTVESLISAFKPIAAPATAAVVAPAGTFVAFTSTTANETFSGTSGNDAFLFNTASGKSLGYDVIKNFGLGDRIITTTALIDPDGDRIIRGDSSDKFQLFAATGGAGQFKVFSTTGGLIDSLSYAGTEARDGTTFYVYTRRDDHSVSSSSPLGDAGSGMTAPGNGSGNAPLAPAPEAGASPGEQTHVARSTIDGTASTNDILRGSALADAFLFDTKAAPKIGKDEIKGFTFADWIVTTSPLLDPDHDGIIRANSSDRFDLFGNGVSVGSLKVFTDAGRPMSSLEFYGAINTDGHEYYVYGQHTPVNVVPELWF